MDASSLGSPHARFVVGFDGTAVPDALRAFCADGLPAGVVLFGRNLESTAQVAALVRELRALWPEDAPPPLIAVDQEGGAVQRLKAPQCPEFPHVPAAAHLAALGPVGLFELGREMAAQLAAVGVNLSFAPVLDVNTRPDNPIIGARAFGATADDVARLALSYAAGLRVGGVMPCGKHFPGHGDTTLDSHVALPHVTHDLARLEAVELAPFRAAVAAGLPLLMTAHIVCEAVDEDVPATLSAVLVPAVLRRRLGYQGAVISDDLEMGAIREHFDAHAVATGCLAADVDLLLVCRDLTYARQLARIVRRRQTPTQRDRALGRIEHLRELLRDHALTASAEVPSGERILALTEGLAERRSASA